MGRIVLLLTAATGTVALLAFLYPSMRVNAADTTPPETTITSGPSGSVIGTTVTFEFTSSEPGSTFKCKLADQDPTRTKCTSPKTYTNLTAGTTYTFRVWAKDAAGNIDPTPAKRTFTPSDGSGGTDCADLVGAGDISSGGSRDQETGDLVRNELDCGAWGVFTTGDNAYPDGTYQNYQVYNAAWGSFKAKTRPAFGNHDYYGSLSAQGANQYWNESPAVPVPGGFTNSNSYYYYDIPNTNWRGIVLNSASSEGPKDNQAPSCETDPVVSPQMVFLNNALNTTKNTVLFWHHARFSASTDHPTTQGATGCSKTFFDEAHDNGADLVVQGHSHVYERYDTRDKDGKKVAGGLTSIVCGLGGNSSDGLQGSPSPAYDKAFTNAWGVCTLTLNTNNAEVSFLRAPDSTVTDSATVAVRP